MSDATKSLPEVPSKREIKFRAWDSQDGMMGVPFDMHYELTHDLDGVWPESVMFMQYTGLKDKNGKEIYEGDIVKHGDESHLDYGWAKVEWNKQWACFELYCFKDGGDTHTSSEFDTAHIDFEVIGNIYENPELA